MKRERSTMVSPQLMCFYSSVAQRRAEITRIAHALCARYGARSYPHFGRCPARVYEAEELVDEALLRVFSGQRIWRAELDIVIYMRMLMKSILFEAMHRANTSSRTIAAGRDVMIAAAGTDEEEQSRRERSRDILENILELFDGDEEATSYILCFWFKTFKREEIAEESGWSVWKVDRIRARVFGHLRRAEVRRILRSGGRQK